MATNSNGSSGRKPTDTSAGLPPATYTKAFLNGKPRDTYNLFNTRLRKAKAFNDDLADYFQARRELEEAYLKALSKISKRSFLTDPSSVPPSFLPIQERLVHEIDEVARVHGDLEHVIINECEDAVRHASDRGAWANVREWEERLGNTLKELNALETQLGKDAKKLDSASGKKLSAAQQKVAETQKAIDETQALWLQEGQRAFGVYQRVDKERLELLKEVVTRFETANADAASSLMKISEQTMQVCLNFDVDTEMQEFALKEGSPSAVAAATASRRPSVPSRSNRRPSNAASTTDQRPSRKAEMPPPPLPTTTSTKTLAPSAGAGSRAGLGASSSNVNLASSTTDLSSTVAPVQPPSAVIAGSGSAPRRPSFARDDTASSIHSAHNGRAENNVGDTFVSSNATKGSAFRNAFSRFGRGKAKDSGKSSGEKNADNYGTLGEEESARDSSARSRDPNATVKGAPGGGTLLDDDPNESGMLNDFALVAPDTAAAKSSTFGNSAVSGVPPRLPQPEPSESFMNGSTLFAAGSAGAAGAATAAAAGSAFAANNKATPLPAAPQVDAEGYSIPPPDRKPWDAPSGRNDADEDEDDDENDVLANLQSNRMSTMNITTAPVPPANSAEDQQALEKMRATLGAPLKAPVRRSTTSRRDRRDVRNTVYNPLAEESSRPLSQFGIPSTAVPSGGLSPIPAGGADAKEVSPSASPIGAGSNLFPGNTGATSDGRTQTMLSSVSSTRGGAVDPFGSQATAFSSLSASGISTAITETVNVLFSGKELTKIMVVGEVAVSLRDVTSTDPVHIRIDAFEQLEKAAPNPAYLTGIFGRPGEYKLDLGALLAQADGGESVQGTILKYQLHVTNDASKRKRYLPLDVSAQWRCEDHQTSLLIHYAPNAEAAIASAADAKLQSLSFVVGIGPSTVSSVMSKPSGTWSAESKKIQWAIPDELPLATAAGAAPQKVLARFQVDGKSTPQPVGVRWSIVGHTLSELGVSVVQDSKDAPSKFTIAETARRCVAGKYLAGP